ncbi:MAG: hypothetical protein INR71_09045, partial [Terriglobus roseus]|nr:hypothetical protein [Terriglobus roseus]
TTIVANSGSAEAGHVAALERPATPHAATAITTASGAAESTAAENHASGTGAQVEVRLQDPSFGDLRVQAQVDRTGALRIEVAGRAQETNAVLDQIAPLLHAAVMQQMEGHGQTRALHLTSAATFDEHTGVSSTTLTGSGTTGMAQSGSSFSFTSSQQQSQLQQRRPYTEQRFAADVDDSESKAMPAAATLLSVVSGGTTGRSAGLSVRI